jgi:hypothetical protein
VRALDGCPLDDDGLSPRGDAGAVAVGSVADDPGGDPHSAEAGLAHGGDGGQGGPGGQGKRGWASRCAGGDGGFGRPPMELHDSLGLAALMMRGGAGERPGRRRAHGGTTGAASASGGSGSGIGAMEGQAVGAFDASTDSLIQHMKVVLLFAVLLRHLQRFTVRTCHAWSKIAPTHAAVCIANNTLQTGAAEGLAFLSGVALAGRVLDWQVVASPLVLIAGFRQLLHPALEFLLSYGADIGTAHLWFVLMIAIGRLLCLPLSRLERRCSSPLRASRLRALCVLAFFGWRLLLAPTHIGWQAVPRVRRLLFFFFYGDRNYLQIVHNLPLFMLGFAHADLRRLGLDALRAPRLARAHAALAMARSSRMVRASLSGSLVVASFVADPLLGGLFNRKSRALQGRPVLAYTRAAVRVGALAILLPRRPTPLTSAGRSQLLAYLLHDAIFTVAAHLAAPMLPALWGQARAALSIVDTDLLGAASSSLTPVLALLELAAYSAACLAVQLALSHPRCLGPLVALCHWPSDAASRLWEAVHPRCRLAARQLHHRFFARANHRKEGKAAATAV